MAYVAAAPNFERPGVVCGFVLSRNTYFEYLGMRIPDVSRGVLFAQGQMYRPSEAPTVGAAPANQQSWLYYNSATGFYWRSQASPIVADDALIGWVLTSADKILALSQQLVEVPEPEPGVTVVPLGPVQPAGPGVPGGGGIDIDVPPMPVFGLELAGRGAINVVALGFETLDNTATTQSARLLLHYVDERAPVSRGLSVPVGTEETEILLSSPGPAIEGTVLQIDAEVLVVDEVLDGGTRYVVARGAFGSDPAPHLADAKVYHLERSTQVIPLQQDFFGKPEAGDFSHSIYLPNARIAAAEMSVLNLFGYSETGRRAFTGTVDYGLRTMAGGQLDIIVEGVLAIQSAAAPPVRLGEHRSIRDVSASVQQAPLGGAIGVDILVGTQIRAQLTIPAGGYISNVVDGRGIGPVPENSEVSIDITSVGLTYPGSRLVVRVRL